MDGSLGQFPVDIVIFALIAGFLALRLRSVLGKKVGFQPMPSPVSSPREAEGPVIEGRAEPVSTPKFDIPAPGTRVGQQLAVLATKERGFTPQQFLSGVDGAFRQVVAAYASGDRTVLRERLTPTAFAAFDAALTARDAAGEVQKSEMRAVNSIAIEDVRMEDGAAGTAAAIDTKIISDQISLTLGKDGKPVTGTDSITEFSDLWTFERLLGVSGSSWRLAAARSA
ncbi:Tim44/TimA family putative adaptor protein [Acetobacter oeni]|uniref:Calcium-binding protein n=1 Tax=Acetobacter oeni TaxID=304077 RepID=A0A511XK35_9PROT|nr:Tim44/TimA family putative adaptor protein [Acetobacter oeni]MBB3883100.1 putative lipid-binding transport protein (Tim44 family) [Acetobacter oeni]NHO19258.1 Tim44/TimA family putative adaptor protein [Acetobacter oeni]GBR07093.1 mitochondrial import inner membrane translocase subunit Tim44 [Acetobacter oeni LMG 21952]GEN63281.1 calcium-binding protein [Acetobacter oeni]